MAIDIPFALICIGIGMLIAVPLTLLFTKKKTSEYQQTIARMEAQSDARDRSEQAYIKELNSAFTTLANNALSQNSDHFLKIAKESFEKHQSQATHDLDKRHESISNLIKPLDDTLKEYKQSLRNLELDRKGAYSSMEMQLKSLGQTSEALRTETGRLVQALHQPKVRGRWGEIQLQNVLKNVGMSENIDFVQEQSFDTEDGKKRPDVVVYLPGDRCIVIDAKTPIDAYLNGIEAENEAEQNKFYKDHARQLRTQVKNLATTNYQSTVPNSPEFVVMFVPGEQIFSTAIQHDRSLFDDALERQVMITTPMTLIGLLKVIAMGWQQEKIAQNSREIATIGRELYARLSKFAKHMRDHEKSLLKAIDTYNNMVGSFERRVLPSTNKLESLQVVTTNKHIDPPDSIAEQPRRLSVDDPDD